MAEYKAVIKDSKLAEEIESATSQYQEQLIVLLKRAMTTERTDDFTRLKMTVGHVLATLGESILFPIYRQHPSLTPEVLKDIIAKEAQPPLSP